MKTKQIQLFSLLATFILGTKFTNKFHWRRFISNTKCIFFQLKTDIRHQFGLKLELRISKFLNEEPI